MALDLKTISAWFSSAQHCDISGFIRVQTRFQCVTTPESYYESSAWFFVNISHTLEQTTKGDGLGNDFKVNKTTGKVFRNRMVYGGNHTTKVTTIRGF
jgi:hypothetical protein